MLRKSWTMLASGDGMRHRFGMQYRLAGIAAKVFPVFAVVDGAVCLAQPEFLQASMISLSLPSYMLIILGLAKLSGAKW